MKPNLWKIKANIPINFPFLDTLDLNQLAARAPFGAQYFSLYKNKLYTNIETEFSKIFRVCQKCARG